MYNKIHKNISKNNIKTITMDIFDTVLMRKIWPEDLQFIKVAELWLEIFQRDFSQKITAFEIYSLRQYIRNEIFRSKYNYEIKEGEEFDVSLELWFGSLVDFIAEKYNKKLTDRRKRSIVERMIEIELTVEHKELFVNHDLISAISRIKIENPDIKVYFASDMYLSTEQIKDLLKHFKVEIFDDGVSSQSVGASKSTGRLFTRLSEVFNIDLFSNLHIGDSLHSDVFMATRVGCETIHINSPRLRRFRTKFGKLKLKTVKFFSAKKDQEFFSSSLNSEKNQAAVWFNYGLIFSQPLFIFLRYVGLVAKNTQANLLMVSSEAKVFHDWGMKISPTDFARKNIFVANKLNRKCMMRALVWFLSKNHERFNAHSIQSTINLGEVSGSRSEIYKFYFGKDFPFSDLNINQRTEDEFFKAFLKDIQGADEKFTKHLRDSYDYVCRFLPKNQAEVVIVDVGWGGTVQLLYAEFLKLKGFSNKVSGLYVGGHDHVENRTGINLPKNNYLLGNVLSAENSRLWNPVLWEYPFTNKPQFDEDQNRLRYIRKGFEKGLQIFCGTRQNPIEYFSSVIKPQIRRLISNPNTNETKIIGSIRFDIGFVDESSFVICDTQQSRVSFWRDLIKRPRTILKNRVFAPNYWTFAIVKYYWLKPMVALRNVYRKIRGRV